LNSIRVSAIIRTIRNASVADMIRVSSTEFGKEVGRYQDAALSQPVIVTRNGRDRTVMISADEYLRLKRRDRQVLAAGVVPEDIVEAVRNAEMDPRHDHLDDGRRESAEAGARPRHPLRLSVVA
jgi:hypothetical protein